MENEHFKYIVNKYNLKGESPMQIKGMGRRKMFGLFAELGLKHGCEVGVQRGRNARVIFDTIPDSSLFLVDPYSDHNYGYRTWDKELHKKFKRQTEERLKNDNVVEKLWGFSEDVYHEVPDNSLDFVYIDGDHSYDFCMLDIILWSRKVKRGGIISGHDYYYRSSRQANMPKVTSAVNDYTKIHKIPFFITDSTKEEVGDGYPSWFWVVDRNYKTNLDVTARRATKDIIYYTDNSGDPKIMDACRRQLKKCADEAGINEILCISQKPLDFGRNIVMDLPRSVLSIFQQVTRGLEESKADVVFLCEHDLLYSPDHFKFFPPERNVFFYDRNRWSVDDVTGKAIFYHTDVPSMLVAYRKLLLKHYKMCRNFIKKNGWRSRYGYSPPKGIPREMRIAKRVSFMADNPSLDIRRGDAWTRKRMNKSQFSSDKVCRGWKESSSVPGWGKIEGRFNEFIGNF